MCRVGQTCARIHSTLDHLPGNILRHIAGPKLPGIERHKRAPASDTHQPACCELPCPDRLCAHRFRDRSAQASRSHRGRYTGTSNDGTKLGDASLITPPYRIGDSTVGVGLSSKRNGPTLGERGAYRRAKLLGRGQASSANFKTSDADWRSHASQKFFARGRWLHCNTCCGEKDVA